MAIYQYNQADFIPLTKLVMDLTSSSYLCNGFKILINFYYPDLEDIVTTDELDETFLHFFRTVDDPTLGDIGACVKAINERRNSLENIFGVSMEEINNDKRLQDLATQFYDEAMLDDFPNDGSGLTSTVAMVRWLCTMIAEGQIDLELTWDDERALSAYTRVDYSQSKHFTALNLLQKLGTRLNRCIRSFDLE